MLSVLQIQVSLLVGSAWLAGGAQPRYSVDESSSAFYPGAPAPNGYQFSSFRGPVSGRIKEVAVPYALPPGTPYHAAPGHGHSPMSVDYIAKPDYAYTFGVHDPESGNAQKQYEARDGDTVRGEYSFVEPDGTLRTVSYSADPVHGFQANVKYGPSGLPAPPPPTPSPSSGYTGPQGRYTGPQARHKYRLRYKQPYYDSVEEGHY